MIVATFNIHQALGVDGRINLERIARVVEKTGAEVVALQELDRGNPRSEGVDQPAGLEEMTGLHVQFFPTVVRGDVEYGIALASRVPRPASFVSLPRLGDEEPRGAIVSESEGLTVIATHLATRPPARSLHLRALGDLARDARPPVVVLGDLNARRRALGPLRRAGLVSGPRVGPTMVSGRKRIDWILASPPARLVEAHTLPTRASDHLPVVGTIELP